METLSAAEAVEQLIRAYGRLVFHLIDGMVHDWHESEDLTQEVFLSAESVIDAARTARGAQFQAKAWLLHSTVNRVRMYRRRQRLMQFVPFSQMETEAAGPDVITQAAAPVQPDGYCTLEGGGDRPLWSPNAMPLGRLSQGCRTRYGCLCSSRSWVVCPRPRSPTSWVWGRWPFVSGSHAQAAVSSALCRRIRRGGRRSRRRHSTPARPCCA